MKTIRLLYPDHVSGGLDTYYFGADLLQYILPQNPNQPVVKVDIIPPNSKEKAVTNGIYAEKEVLLGIRDAQERFPKKIRIESSPSEVTVWYLLHIDYLHGKYKKVGIIWIDAHPDVSTLNDGYPNAHAMVLGSLLGHGAAQLTREIKNSLFKPDEIFYIGLQPLHDYQEKYLDDMGVKYKVQDKTFVTSSEINDFIGRFDHILIHFDIDVLDEHFFHSTYFANSELVGDGAGGGKMTIEKLSEDTAFNYKKIRMLLVLTIAEYLPFDEHRLHKMFAEINLFIG